VFISFFNDQRMRVLSRMDDHRSAHTRSGGKASTAHKSLEPDSLWDEDVEDGFLQQIYLAAVDELGPDAIVVPKRIVSADIMWDLQHEYVESARTALAERVVRINETTRQAIAQQVEEGVRRGYSIPRIANGFSDEDFKGIHGVFNDATAARAETIARTETGLLFNQSANAAYRSKGLTHVIIFDGTGDADCAEAAGARWTLDYFEQNLLGHPNCVRAAAPDMSEA
jgi:hypothetical protein